MKKYIIFLSFFFLMIISTNSIHAQTGYYHKLLTGGGAMNSSTVIEASDKSFLINGKWNGQEGFLLKTDSLSNVIWCKLYSQQTTNFQEMNLRQIINSHDSNLIMCGSIVDVTLGIEEGFILKLDFNGDTLWAKKITIPSAALLLTSVCQTIDSGYAFVGTIREIAPSTTNHFFVMRTDKDGNVLWSNKYTAGNSSNYSNYIYSSLDSGFVFMGYMESLLPYDAGAAFFKLDQNGNVSWAKKYANGGVNFCSGDDVAMFENGFICELSTGNSTVLLKLDNQGNILKDTSFLMFNSAGLLYSYTARLKRLSNDNILFINGDDYSTNSVRLDTNFQVLWSDFIMMRSYDFVETTSKEIHFLGGGPLWGVQQNNPDGFPPDLEIGIVHVDSLGSIGGCIASTGVNPSVTPITAATITSVKSTIGLISKVKILSSSQSVFGNDTCVTFTGGVGEGNIPDELKLYPNPSNGNFKIDSPLKEKGKITIRNYRSEEIFSANISIESITIDLSKQPNGIYFCQWQNNSGRMFHGKIVISK